MGDKWTKNCHWRSVYCSLGAISEYKADLAQKAGVSRTYIKDIEVGRVTNVGLNYIVGIAGALGVSLAYLMGMSEDTVIRIA